MKIEIKNRFTGSIIFSLDKENNTILETVKEYIRQEKSKGKTSPDLRSADLTSADLSNSDLRGSDLRSADLSNSDLSNSDLRGVDLSNSDLRSVDLRNADLTSANLRNAENKELSNLPIFCNWSHSLIGERIQIGCETKSVEDWDEFFNSDDELSTKRGTNDFKQIQAVYLSYKAYLTHLKN